MNLSLNRKGEKGRRKREKDEGRYLIPAFSSAYLTSF